MGKWEQGVCPPTWSQLTTKHHQAAPREGRWKNVKMIKIQQKCEWERAAIQSRTWSSIVIFLKQEAVVWQRPGLHSTGGWARADAALAGGAREPGLENKKKAL